MSTASRKREDVALVKAVETVKAVWMVSKVILLLLLALALPLIGCSKEGFYEGMYRGLQQREEIIHPAMDPFPPDQPSYNDYRRDREEALRRDEER
ncbi:MAG: hypothetical protein D3925_07215 [Candidatus Electrothrix sp. AR5]|nr:hypothetical protein [Candidatus Electrothrix sp. AR5]